MLSLLFFLGVIQACWGIKPNNITIGGLFEVFDDDNNIDASQIEHLNAFVLAIEDINANDTILPNHHINYAIRDVHHIGTASISSLELLDIPDLAGVVSSLLSEQAKIATALLSDNSVVTVNSMSSDTTFGVRHLHPFNAQVHPIHSYEGVVLQHILCDLGLSRITVFSDDNLFGHMYTMELLDGSYCNIELMLQHVFLEWETDFDEAIQDSLESGATIFLIFFDVPAQIAKLLEDGYAQGLFREGTQIFLLREDFLQHLSNSAPVADILHGVLVVEYDADYGVHLSHFGEHFVEYWNNMTTIPCSAVDYTGHQFLIQNSVCASLNHEDFKNGTKTMAETTALTFDAVYTLVYGLQIAYEKDTNAILNGTAIRNAIYDDVDFVGATGHINIYEGDSSQDFFAAGNREEGNFYKVVNFKTDLYQEDPDHPFAIVKMWSLEDGLFDCDYSLNCTNTTYNTADNTLPSAFPDYAYDTPPAIIKIGGLFGAFRGDGTIDRQQAEHMAAFMLAVEEINNKTDNVFDDILPNTQVVVAVVNDAETNLEAIEGVDYLYDAFFHSGVIAAVSSLPSEQSAAADIILAEDEIFVAFSEANASSFGEPNLHPFAVHSNIIDSVMGIAVQKLLCDYFDLHRVTVFHSTTAFGARSAVELHDGTFCPVEELSVHEFLTGDHHFDHIIELAADVGSRVFVFFMDSYDAASLLEQGHASGLFEEGTLVIIPQVDDGLMHHFSSGADVASIMKGVFTLEYFPDHGEYATEAGRKFVDLFTHHPVISTPNNCRNDLDDTKERTIYKNRKSSACAEVNYTEYLVGERKIAPFTANTYDAAIMTMIGLDNIFKNNASAVVDAHSIEAAVEYVSFYGATGLVELSHGDPDHSYYGKGTRQVGVHFYIRNFNEDAYAQNIEHGKVIVGILGFEDGVTDCPDGFTCYDPVYNTNDNSVPKSTKPDIHVKMHIGVVGVLIFLAIVILLYCAFLYHMLVTFGQTRHIKNAQGSLLYFVVTGMMFGGFRVIIAALPVSLGGCIAQLWLGHLAFAFIFGGIIVKSYRLNKIFNTAVEKTVVTTDHCVKVVSSGILGLVLCLVIVTAAGMPIVAHDRVYASNQTTDSAYCGLVHPETQTALFLLEGIFLAYGFQLCYALKDIPDKYNESEQSLDAIALVVLAAVIVFPLMYLVGLDPVDGTTISSLVIALVVLAIGLMVFTLKIMKVYRFVGIQIYSRSQKSLMAEDADLVTYPVSVITDEEKFDHCKKQIRLLQSAMLDIGRDDSTHGSSAVRSQSRTSSQGD